MEFDNMMNNLAAEVNSTLKAMSKSKSVEEKLQYSQAVKNLCEAFSAIIAATSDIIPYDEDDEDTRE